MNNLTETARGSMMGGEAPYEFVQHPSHYNRYDIEVIDMMKRIWGREAVMLWCEMTAFKYRMRIGLKPGETMTQDLDKEKWYLDKVEKLRDEID